MQKEWQARLSGWAGCGGGFLKCPRPVVLVGSESCRPGVNSSLRFTKASKQNRIMVAPQKKQAWKAESEEAALLFNLFQERVFHPDSYSAAGIYRNEDLNPIFGKFDSKNFGRYCQFQYQ